MSLEHAAKWRNRLKGVALPTPANADVEHGNVMMFYIFAI